MKTTTVSWFATLFGIWTIYGGLMWWAETGSPWGVGVHCIGIALVWFGYGLARCE
jgi:hypothetical protein